MSLFEQKISPMLAFLSEPFDSDEFCFELKFDGTRTIAYVDVEKKDVRFLNRRMKFFQSNYPELREIWKNINAKKVILDSEICVFKAGKPDFYALAEREHVGEKTRIEILSKIMPATIVVFDILHKDGVDLIDLPLIKRKKILEQTVKESERVVLSAYVIGKGREFFREAKRRKLEGVMAKKLDSVYEIGKRSKNWLKIKYLKTLDVVLIGYTSGTGWREKFFGSLIGACYHQGKLRYIGKIGTGFDEKQIEEIYEKLEKIKVEKCPLEKEPELKLPQKRKATWVKPKLVCEVKFMNLSKDLIMRAPSFVRLREDKLPEECVLGI